MHNTCVDSNRSGSRVSFIVKQRSDYGFYYMLFAIMLGYDPRTLH